MQFVVAVFVEEVRVLGRCSSRVSCCVSQVFVDMGGSRGDVKVCDGIDKDVSIE